MKIAFIYVNNEKCANQGAGYVASVVLEAGYNLDFYDSAYLSIEELILKTHTYDLLLLSTNTLSYHLAMKLAINVKRINPNITILLGGVHTIITYGQILRDCDAFDYICIGEGEDFILEFLDKFSKKEDLTSIANLGYRSPDGVVHINPVRPPTDLTKLPRFRHELFGKESIILPYPYPGFCYVYATRGCPYKCSYCCNSCYLDVYKGDYLRLKSIDYVIEDLIHLRDIYGMKFVFFGDEMVVFNEQYVTELFTRIHKEVQLPYGCMARVERVTDTLVEVFATTNCKYVGMGVECGDEEFRKTFLNRHMTNAQIISAFERLRKIPGIKLTSYNMTGYPVPNDAELTESTKRLNAILRPDILQISLFFPFPGTKLFDYCMERGLIDFGKWNTARDMFSESVIRRDKL